MLTSVLEFIVSQILVKFKAKSISFFEKLGFHQVLSGDSCTDKEKVRIRVCHVRSAISEDVALAPLFGEFLEKKDIHVSIFFFRRKLIRE